MALKLDNNLINELGLGALPEQEKQLLLRQIYERLEMNVGVRLADQMSNEQLDEFEKFVDANDDKGAFQWLETNFPNYKDVVNEEFEKLKTEIKQYAPQMLAVAQHNAAQAAAGGAPQAPPSTPNGQYPPQQPGQPYGQPAPGMGYGGQPYGPAPGPQPYYPPAGQPPQYGQPGQYPGYPGQQPPVQPGQGNETGSYPGYPPQQPPAGPGQ